MQHKACTKQLPHQLSVSFFSYRTIKQSAQYTRNAHQFFSLQLHFTVVQNFFILLKATELTHFTVYWRSRGRYSHSFIHSYSFIKQKWQNASAQIHI